MAKKLKLRIIRDKIPNLNQETGEIEMVSVAPDNKPIRFNYRQTLLQAVASVPSGGEAGEQMSTRIRLMLKLNTVKDKGTLDLEDDEVEALYKWIVKDAKWQVVRPGILHLINDVKALHGDVDLALAVEIDEEEEIKEETE
jgi:hypothetical protein